MPGASDSTGCASVEPRKPSRLFDSHGPYAVARNVVVLLATGGNLWLCVFALRNEPWSWSRMQEHPPSRRGAVDASYSRVLEYEALWEGEGLS